MVFGTQNASKHERFFDTLRIVFTSVPKAVPRFALAKSMRMLLFTSLRELPDHSLAAHC